MTVVLAPSLVPATHIVESGVYLPGDGDGIEWAPLLAFKLRQCTPYFIASICAEGVQRPILWRHGEIWNAEVSGWCPATDTRIIRDGHHRLAVAYRYGLSVPLTDTRTAAPDTLPSFHTVGEKAA